MNLTNKNNKLYWYILILLSLFILVLFTRNQIYTLQENLDEKNNKEVSLLSKRNELDKLNEIKIKVEEKNSWIDNYINSIKEDELLSYIYSKVEEDNLKYTDWISTIRSLNIKEWKINELWFYESLVTLSIRVPNEERMNKLLDFFVKEDSKYKFFIDSFSYPKNSSSIDSSYNITIPLKIFYK